jgi:hypothetical protein
LRNTIHHEDSLRIAENDGFAVLNDWSGETGRFISVLSSPLYSQVKYHPSFMADTGSLHLRPGQAPRTRLPTMWRALTRAPEVSKLSPKATGKQAGCSIGASNGASTRSASAIDISKKFYGAYENTRL